LTVFIDTSALFALLDENDPQHRRATETLGSLREKGEVLQSD